MNTNATKIVLQQVYNAHIKVYYFYTFLEAC